MEQNRKKITIRIEINIKCRYSINEYGSLHGPPIPQNVHALSPGIYHT